MWEEINNLIGLVNTIAGIANIFVGIHNYLLKKKAKEFTDQIEIERKEAVKENKRVCNICKKNYENRVSFLEKQFDKSQA